MAGIRRVALLAAAVVLATAGGTAGAAESDDRVRPGLGYTGPLDGCSFSFLLNGSDGRSYVATAGHCGVRSGEEKLWLRDDGPVVKNDEDRDVGRFVYAVKDNAKFIDFGLIRLARGIKGNPQMCAWGGPTRLLTEARPGLTELRHHGQGLVMRDVAPTRTAVARSLPHEPYTFVHGAASLGDSGSSVITADGAAMGQIVQIGVAPLAPDGGVGVVRLEHALRAATQRTGIRFTLRTAPLLPTPLPTASC